jgi:mono/diheme cytochrome c family protein
MRHTIAVCLALAAALHAPLGAAQPAGDEPAALASLDRALRKVSAFYKSKKYSDSALAAGEAQRLLADWIAAGDAPAYEVARYQKKLAAAERLLKARGLDLTGKPAGTSDISFIKDVLPIFASKCRNCHIRNARGGFSMATFADLKKGSDAGIVFNPGKSQGSRLVEVIETGDMPRAGPKVTAEELAKISAWIDAGARFDGGAETVPLASLAPAPNASGPSMPQVVQATGSEGVQFVRDLAPVLVASCIDCHGGPQPAARLDLSTFATLLRGGDSGPIIAPGKPADSLLVQKLRGMAGAQMPLRRPPLEEAVIARFESWIAEGAKFDWSDPVQPLDLAVRIMAATRMSHDELSAVRVELAGKNWRLAIPDEVPDQRQADAFLLLGNLPPPRMDELAELAKVQQGKIAAMFKAGKPFLKGRLTLFAFEHRFDYSEFGTMVEKRELPSDWTGHWRYNVVDAYGCLVVPNDDKETPALLLAQQFAGAYIESQAEVPRWFAVGAARVAAGRANPRNRTVHQWDEAAKAALAAGRGPDLFLESGDIVTGDAAALSFAFLKALMSKPARFSALLKDLGQGSPFSAAFKKHYSGEPAAVAGDWWRAAGGR